jgi:hypothetical protein
MSEAAPDVTARIRALFRVRDGRALAKLLLWLLGGCLLISFGTAWIIASAPDAMVRGRARFWRGLPCAIIRSAVSEARRQGTGTLAYRIEIEYRYNLGGAEYMSGRYSFDSDSFDDRGQAEGIVKKYPAGAGAFCHANPSRPSEAVLNRGPLLNIALPLGGLAPLAGGLFCVNRARLIRRSNIAGG